MLGSDLPTLRNPAPAIGVIAATESEFDPLHPPDQPASASATPRHGRSCFAADRPLVALHQDQERLHTKDRQDLLQSLPSLAAHSNRSCLLRSGASPRCSAAKVQPVAVTTTFMPEGYAIREYKRIVQGGSAAATELLCYGTSVVVERLEEKGQGFRT